MHITNIKLRGVRCFEQVDIALAPRINVIIGANSTGKSTLLKSVLGLQYFPPFDVGADLRQPFAGARPLMEITCGGSVSTPYLPNASSHLHVIWDGQSLQLRAVDINQTNTVSGPIFQAVAPSNAIYPFLSRRKSTTYGETMSSPESLAVRINLENLYAKLDYVTNPERPSYAPFMQACEEILGLRISAVASNSGKRAAYVVDNFKEIPVSAMGEGVTNILGLLVDLFVAEGKVFLIEEVENDIHPTALKRLLGIIATSAQRNQFIVSTHSNIVVRQLCSEPSSKLFGVSMRLVDRIPTSIVEEIAATPAARRAVLEDLGYEFADLDMHAAWLFLEESSGEQIIRDFLVPWFAPKLTGRLRTFSAGGFTNLAPKFDDFDRLFVFLNLESAYKNRAWVIIDAGDAESKIIADLSTKWVSKGWAQANFQQFQEHDFERYFPDQFKVDIEGACAEKDKQQKRALKAALLKRVLTWIHQDPEAAKLDFQKSAADVIDRLRAIESAVVR